MPPPPPHTHARPLPGAPHPTPYRVPPTPPPPHPTPPPAPHLGIRVLARLWRLLLLVLRIPLLGAQQLVLVLQLLADVFGALGLALAQTCAACMSHGHRWEKGVWAPGAGEGNENKRQQASVQIPCCPACSRTCLLPFALAALAALASLASRHAEAILRA